MTVARFRDCARLAQHQSVGLASSWPPTSTVCTGKHDLPVIFALSASVGSYCVRLQCHVGEPQRLTVESLAAVASVD